jgi:site-specific recombinase XerD
MHAEQSEPSPYNHYLQQFLTFLKHERGFADATVINRRRSLKPFLAWIAGQCAPLSTVSPVMITKYFTSAVAGKWKRTSISFHVQSLRSFFRYASGQATDQLHANVDDRILMLVRECTEGATWLQPQSRR